MELALHTLMAELYERQEQDAAADSEGVRELQQEAHGQGHGSGVEDQTTQGSGEGAGQRAGGRVKRARKTDRLLAIRFRVPCKARWLGRVRVEGG